MRLPFKPTGLPVEAILPQLDAALSLSGLAVLQAEPGAGKTSLVPPALVGQAWLGGQKILMLQPRRVAARASAERIALLLGETVGQTAGYRVSLDSRIGPGTRIEVLTEGILSRMIQDQPELPGVGTLIFDEFHERSQHADLGLAMALEVRETLRPDLRILVMSATIDAPALAALLGGDQPPAAIIDCPGRSFPVDAQWRPAPAGADGRSLDYWQDSRAFLALVAERVRQGLAECPGDILVFLPGQGEINRVAEALGNPGLGAEVLRLHGSLAAGEQAAVLRPGTSRRVILATNVAETSLTIPGIALVIDSGLVRVNRFDARLGMDRLVTERVSLASSVQRQGRAGRLADGACWKLWPQGERLEPFLPPETERADLADFVLAARAWGCRQGSSLRLLTPPSSALWLQAESLLANLGALAPDGALGPLGRSMAGLGLHPRLARLVLAARREGPASESLAWACAALLGDRDILGNAAGADFQTRLDLLTGNQSGFSQPADRAGVNQAQLQRCRELWRRQAPSLAGQSEASPGTSDPGRLLALAWPDRIGRLDGVEKDRRNNLVANYQLSSGRRATLSGQDAQHPPGWLVALDADAGDAVTTIRLFAAIEAEAGIENLLPELVRERLVIAWDGLRPRASRQLVIDQLVISDKPVPAGQVPRQAVLDSWLASVRPAAIQGEPAALAAIIDGLPWSEASQQLLTRLRWAQARQADRWPDCGAASLASTLETWLLPQVKASGGPLLDAETLKQALDAHVGWAIKSRLDSEVPSHWQVPSGSRRPLEYPTLADAGAAAASHAFPAPVLAVRIQEIFGLDRQPAILGVPVQLHLLSPGQKPLQVTSDLASFWSRTYPEIRKEMRGRYPRHYWPDNPLEAEPTARAKPRGT